MGRRILFLTCEYPPFAGGIGTYSAQLARAASAAGADVAVIAPRYGEDDPGVGLAEERLLGHHAVSPGQAIEVFARMRAQPADAIILAADIRTVLIAHFAKVFLKRPYRAAVHGSEVAKFARGHPLAGLVRRAYLGAETICANSQATLSHFEASFGPAPQARVCYLGVDEVWFSQAEGGFENPKLRTLPADAQIVSTVGRIEDRKGQTFALDVVKRAALKQPVFVAAGEIVEPDYAAAMETRAAELGVRLIMPGRLSNADVARLYQRSACHLLCARPMENKIEGFGLVLIEAAAQACPSIAARVGGIPEVLADGAGEVFDPDDLDAMAAAVARLANDPAARAAAGEAARVRARSFTWRACAEKTFPELFA